MRTSSRTKSEELPDLDELDQKIVKLLQTNGRISIPELAKQVNTSRPTAYARFDRLVENGTITGFSAEVNHEHLGLAVTALLMINTDQTEWRRVADTIRSDQDIVWLGLSTGNADFVALIRAHDLSHLRDVILDRLLQTPGVTAIVTNIVLEEML